MVKDQEFLEYVIKAIVDFPDDVKVERTVDERGVLITLDVNQKDMGMVIGRQGTTAKAIRTLLRVVGARNDSRVNLKINEPAGSNFQRGGGYGYGSDQGQAAPADDAQAAPASDDAQPAQDANKSIDDIVNDMK